MAAVLALFPWIKVDVISCHKSSMLKVCECRKKWARLNNGEARRKPTTATYGAGGNDPPPNKLMHSEKYRRRHKKRVLGTNTE